MSDSRNPFNYPLNPQYGKGVFHRKLRFTPGSDEKGHFIDAQLEDCNHGFCIKVYHNGENVTAIAPEAKRIPLSTCEGAKKPLEALVGKSLHDSAKTLNEKMNPQGNCTHWLDLSIWAIAQAAKGLDEVLEYHIQIPDELDQGSATKLYKNGDLLLDWHIKDWTVQKPENFAGQPFYKGFAAWANTIEDAELREAAFVLQKGYFVSRARYYDIDALAGEKANAHTMMIGACYSYSEPRVSVAERTKGTVRDFTNKEAQLLKFQ